MSPARTQSGAPTALLERAMEILGCFSDEHQSLSLSEFAAMTELPISTCHRIAGSLVGGGFLARGTDRRYRIGTKLWTIAHLAPLSERLRERSLPTLARLYEETGENVTLAVIDRGRALYVDRIVGERSVPTIIRVGGHLPLHTTGVGKVLLAHQPQTVIERYLSTSLTRATADSVTDPELLRTELELVKQRGYAITRGEMSAGSGSIAVPILRNQQCLAAVGVVVHIARLDTNRLVSTLTSAAQSIAAELAR
jgi:DNA-binding IclR family transcriptional regulator